MSLPIPRPAPIPLSTADKIISNKHAYWYSRGDLPHFETSARLQMITYRLADSVPQDVVRALHARMMDGGSQTQYRLKIENLMDSGLGSCCLRDPANAAIVRDTWLFQNHRDYRLHAWVIMPNHVHVLVDVFPHATLPDIVKAWKSISARKIQAQRGQVGSLWQKEYWDRYIRNGVHYERAVNYIYENPVDAGLARKSEEWLWSNWGESQQAGTR